MKNFKKVFILIVGFSAPLAAEQSQDVVKNDNVPTQVADISSIEDQGFKIEKFLAQVVETVKDSFIQGVEREDASEADRCLPADKVKKIVTLIVDNTVTVGKEAIESGKKIAGQGLDVVQNKIDALNVEKENETSAAVIVSKDNKDAVVVQDSKTTEKPSSMASVGHFLRHHSLAIGTVAFVTVCAVTVYAYQQYNNEGQDDLDDEDIR